MIQEVYYDIDDVTGQLNPIEKYEYTYDNLYTYSDLLLPADYEGLDRYFHHKLIGGASSEWNLDKGIWVVYQNITVYYSEQNIVNSPLINLGELKTYPNPVKEYVVFDLKEPAQPASIEIYNLQGSKVISENLLNNKQISVSGLKSGIYFYKVNQSGKIYSGKIMVE